MMYVVDAFDTHDDEFAVNTWKFARMSDVITACINIMTNAQSGISRIAITLPPPEAKP